MILASFNPSFKFQTAFPLGLFIFNFSSSASNFSLSSAASICSGFVPYMDIFFSFKNLASLIAV